MSTVTVAQRGIRLLIVLTYFFLLQGQTGQATSVEPQSPAPHQLYLPLFVQGEPASAAAPTAHLSTPQLLEQALARGEITASERLLYLAYALYEPQSLPLPFHSNVGWYGTSYVVEVQEFTQSVSSASSQAVQQELSRLNTLAATVCDNEDGPNTDESTNFHFNYGVITGSTIDAYKTSMEATFNIEVTQFGWANPPLCTGGDTCDGETNPWGKYPIQVADLGGGLYGYVTTGGAPYTGFIGDNPNTPATETDAIASCMVLNDDFSQFPEGTQGALDSTTSHEFVHAIQNGYGDPDTREDAMWYESSAAYMEDEIFDNANSDYQYLWPVTTNCLGEWPNNDEPGGVSQYSNFLFFRHVAEHNGGTNIAGGGEDIMQHAWENIGAGQGGLDAYSNALVAEGTTLPDAFHTYAIAAKFSKACGAGYDAPYCFEEGAAYAAFVDGLPPVQGSIAANPGSFNGSVNDNYAINWVNLPVGSPYQVTLSNTASGGQLRGSLVCDTGTTFAITPFASVVGAGNATTINAFDATSCTSAVAVITNQEQTSGNPNACTAHSYTLSVNAAQSLNTSVTQTGVTTANNPTPQNCPATGTNLTIYTVTPTFQNSSANTFTDLYFRVKTLEYTTPQGGQQPSLCNATTVVDSGSVGSILAVPNSSLPDADNAFNPNDNLIQAFQIGRPVAAQFRIKVDLFSSAASAADAVGAGEEYLGSFEDVFDPTPEALTPVQQLFLPLVTRP